MKLTALHARSAFAALALVAFAAACNHGTRPAASMPPASTSPIPATHATVVAPGEAKVGDRTKCIVSGEEFTVTDASPKVEYKGKTYYFCCQSCPVAFQKDPEKYLAHPGSGDHDMGGDHDAH